MINLLIVFLFVFVIFLTLLVYVMNEKLSLLMQNNKDILNQIKQYRKEEE
ncbi:hypothetical protein [Priestia taiwanensis]|uniref:Uncharacterized protein n=1 Tax=Priestia taiwanensis TaxID=1347902 RepID=A0A917ERC3_9BACI|nr:hypothetical protein [Priestia taiwanensis]MBM7363503.1 Na+-driven multidrug efflux pump [Priestia taiwanensis]GGE76573.1 hypothetical protein GCM10007140_27870 [Priestia taiwanensis]